MAVVGGGFLGVRLLLELARRGVKATLYERREMGAGASGVSGAMLRVYHGEPWVSDLAAASLSAFSAVTRSGFAYVEPAARRDAVLREVARLAALAPGWPIEVLDPAAARARVPGLAVGDDELVVFEPHAGYADAPGTLKSWANEARGRGASVRTGARVEGLDVADGRVAGLRIAGERVDADLVVVAGGAWTPGLLASAGVDAGLFLKVIQVTRLTGADAYQHPCFFERQGRAYGRSAGPGASLVGIASDVRDTDPDRVLLLDERDAQRAHERAAARFPALEPRRAAGGVRCVDAYAARGPLCGPVPGIGGLFALAGYGGTGFKVAPAVAARVAGLVFAALEVYPRRR